MMLKTNIRQEGKAKSATRMPKKNAGKIQKTQTKTTTTKRQMKPTTTKRTEANKIKYKLQQYQKNLQQQRQQHGLKGHRQPWLPCCVFLCPLALSPTPALYLFCAVLRMAHPPRQPRVELNNVKHKKVLHTFSKSVWKMQTTQQEHNTRQARYRAAGWEGRREGKRKRCSQLGNCWKIVKQLQQSVLDRGRDQGARDALLDGYVQLKFAFLCLLCPTVPSLRHYSFDKKW